MVFTSQEQQEHKTNQQQQQKTGASNRRVDAGFTSVFTPKV